MYPVFIGFIQHNQEFTWENSLMTVEDEKITLKMFAKWTVNDLIKPQTIQEQFNCHSSDVVCEIQTWLDDMLSGDYMFSAIGRKHKCFIYGFFEKQEDAILFKMTWID